MEDSCSIDSVECPQCYMACTPNDTHCDEGHLLGTELGDPKVHRFDGEKVMDYWVGGDSLRIRRMYTKHGEVYHIDDILVIHIHEDYHISQERMAKIIWKRMFKVKTEKSDAMNYQYGHEVNGVFYTSRELLAQFGNEKELSALHRVDHWQEMGLQYNPGFVKELTELKERIGAVSAQRLVGA